jgi:hypothetical protein
VEQVRQPVHDGCRGDQQETPAREPWRQVAVPATARVSKAVCFVDDHEPRPARRQHSATHPLVREQSDGHSQMLGRLLPLGQQRGRNDAGHGPAGGEHSRDRERHVGLATAHGIGQECRSVATDGSRCAAEASDLTGYQPHRCGTGILLRKETLRESADHGPRTRPRARPQGREQRLGHGRQRFSDDAGSLDQQLPKVPSTRRT